MKMSSKTFLVAPLFYLVLGTSGCGAIEPTDPGGPRAPGPVYPIRIAETQQRQEEALGVWRQLAQQLGVAAEDTLELHPVTATVVAISPEVSLFLPKVGDHPEMNEDELRESLRRFIGAWQRLIGAQPAQLSLVERENLPDGTKTAHYEQRPFRYPLRGEFGQLRIHFRSDRRVLSLRSTCIADTEQVQNAIVELDPQISRDAAAARLRNNTVSYTGPDGRLVSYTVPANAAFDDVILVVLVRSSTDSRALLEFRLAWEFKLRHAPITTVYMDSQNGEILDASKNT